MMGGGAAAGTSPGTSNLISWWKLEEASGTRNDSHGTNHLADNNTVLNDAAGKKSNAASFVTANSEWLSIASNASLQTGDIDFTVGLWVKVTGASTVRFAGKADAAGSASEWYLEGLEFSGQYYPTFSIKNNSLALNNDIINANTWAFVVAWHDATANKIYIQVDNGSPASENLASGPTAAADGFSIGRAGERAANYMGGLIDEVFLYKKVLTAAQRTWLYNAGAGRTYGDL